jgi:hypothetical protein
MFKNIQYYQRVALLLGLSAGFAQLKSLNDLKADLLRGLR